jgi:hypothetical protein
MLHISLLDLAIQKYLMKARNHEEAGYEILSSLFLLEKNA